VSTHELRVAAAARLEFDALPLRIQARVQEVFIRLIRWPEVSGVKPLRGSLKGAYRIPTGDWRVLFTVDERGRCASPCSASLTGVTFTRIEVLHGYGDHPAKGPAICAGTH
jgi:mRNA-degrading endonuclease RelE of RelBE toxin-antitoxin system